MKQLRLLALALAILVSAAPAVAQSAEERAQQMNRIVDGLNSPDPVIRLVTLENAMATKDKNLQRLAISTALASSDATLRTSAVEANFGTKKSFIVEFTGVAPGNRDNTYYSDKSGGQIEVRIQDFDKATGDFIAFTPYSLDGNRRIVGGQGNLAGDRLSFDVNVNYLSGGQTCSGAVTAKTGQTVLTGTMSCAGQGYNIKVDLLR